MLRWASRARAATFVQRGLSSRGRKYLPAQVEKSPRLPHIAGADLLVVCHSCLLPLLAGHYFFRWSRSWQCWISRGIRSISAFWKYGEEPASRSSLSMFNAP